MGLPFQKRCVLFVQASPAGVYRSSIKPYFASKYMISSAVGNLMLFLSAGHKRRQNISILSKFIVYAVHKDLTSSVKTQKRAKMDL